MRLLWFSVKRSDLADVFKFLIVVGFLVWLTAQGSEKLGYNWQWYRVPAYLYSLDSGSFVAGPLLKGLSVTLKITVISLFLSLSFGLITALFRLSHSLVAKALARFYVELIRNTPLLTQIFFLYFVLAPVLDLGRFTAAILALSLFEGAYASEIFRAGIASIHKGQWEAAYSLGLSSFQTYRRVILPQAVRRILPPLTGQAVSLVKDSALVSTVAIYELTKQGEIIISETFLTFEVWFTIAAIYLSVTLVLSLAAGFMEKRMKMAY
ncbi:MAG: amino acid ABC transporter permease [Pseudomonadota bacterium]